MADTEAKSVEELIGRLSKEAQREDAKRLLAWMEEETGEQGRLWSGTMVGFGSYRYRYASGREGESFRIGFAPRAQGMSLYLMSDFEGEEALMKRVGKHKMGKCCMTFKRLDDMDEPALRELVRKSFRGKIEAEF